MIPTPTNTLYTYMNGVLVGRLMRESTRQYVFVYDQKWLEQKNPKPISLSMPLTEVPIKGEVVYHFFNNLLPDSELIRKRIQTRFQLPSNNPFDLLSEIGRDCVGALQLLSAPMISDIKRIESKPISNKKVAELLKNYRSSPLGMDLGTDFRISIAGAQEKTSLLRYKDKWHLPLNATPASHIIKLPIGRIEHAGFDLGNSVENEWLCLKILAAFGLPVNKARMAKFDNIKTLVVERFDRRWSDDKGWLMRAPQEDMCQAMGVPAELKYQSDGGPGIKDIMDLLSGAISAKENRHQFMKSVFLFWVLGAIDGHAKNFSIFIEAGGNYRLTPLYDVISAYPLACKRQLEWQDIKMATGLKGKNQHYRWDGMQLRHWFTMAQLCYFPKESMQLIIDDVCDQMENIIANVGDHLPIDYPIEMAESIFQGMRKVKERCMFNKKK